MKKIIQSRLAKLPPKVAQPLTHLVKIGQMKEQDIKTVLDAGEITGNYPHACRLCGWRHGTESAACSGRRYGGHGEETRTTQSDWTGALAAGERNMTGWRKLSHCVSSAKRT